MKTILLLISFGVVTLTVGLKRTFSTDFSSNAQSVADYQAKKQILATFDGYEGGYYFFSDEESKSIQLEAHDHPFLTEVGFESGDVIGKKFLFEVNGRSEVPQKSVDILNIVALP